MSAGRPLTRITLGSLQDLPSSEENRTATLSKFSWSFSGKYLVGRDEPAVFQSRERQNSTTRERHYLRHFQLLCEAINNEVVVPRAGLPGIRPPDLTASCADCAAACQVTSEPRMSAEKTCFVLCCVNTKIGVRAKFCRGRRWRGRRAGNTRRFHGSVFGRRAGRCPCP
jgi:hypothetical protein